MSDILFPLRSNSAWFLKEETKVELEKRIKTCIMLYDCIHFQDALYQCTIWENGAYDMMLPPNAIGFDRSKIRYFSPGAKSGLTINKNGKEPNKIIYSGETKVGYHADFFPIIKDAGMIEVEYIKFHEIELNDEYIKKAKNAAKIELKKHDFESILGGNSFFRQKIIESLYIDSTLSTFFQAPIIIDQNTGPAISLIGDNIIDLHDGLVKDVFFKNWISIGLPDFSGHSWEDLDKLHTSKAGFDFRRMIDGIVQAVISEQENIDDLEDLTHIVGQNFSKELVAELISHLPTSEGVALNLGLNILPFNAGMVVGGIKDSIALAKSKRSWVSLLKK